jgi:hypothetical protein
MQTAAMWQETADDLTLYTLASFIHHPAELKNGEWEPVVMHVLRSAGFQPLRVERKDCFGDLVDEHHVKTGEKYFVNDVSRINAPQEINRGEIQATLWLDLVWRKITATPLEQAVDRLKQLIDERRLQSALATKR